MTRMKTAIGAGVAAMVLVLPAAASAHVEIDPSDVPAGAETVLNVRVPNEMEDATTNKVQLEMPDGFVQVATEAIPGWEATTKTEKLDQPVKTDDGTIDTQVHTVTWTATDPSAAIQPGQFQQFPISVGMPDDGASGDVLTFPAVQTYDNGDVVRWIGGPVSEEPAPTVTLTDAETGGMAGMSGMTMSDTSSSDDDGGAPTWLAILGVVLGAIGIGVGGVALRRRKA